MTIHHIGSFVYIFNEFFEALFSDQDSVGFEKTENI